MGRLLIRVDDFPGTKPEEFYRHNLEGFERFHRVVAGRGLDYVLGVIPRHSTDGQLRWLGCAGMELALHGVAHDERYPNEFREHQTEADVTALLRVAKMDVELRSGRPVSTYIPPHNVVDARTCRALVATGFRRLMGGPGTDPAVAAHAKTLGLEVILSYPPYEYGRSDELLERGSVDHISRELRTRDVWLALHWTWETNIGLPSLEKYLDTLLSSCGTVGS